MGATSLSLETERQYDLDKLKRVLWDELNIYYQLLRDDKEVLNQPYEAHLYRKGDLIDFTRSDRTQVRGMIQGVEKTGLLKVVTLEGDHYKFNIKEIAY